MRRWIRTSFFEAAASLALRLAPGARLYDEDVRATVRARCEHVRRQRGPVAAVWAGTAEVANIIWTSTHARLRGPAFLSPVAAGVFPNPHSRALARRSSFALLNDIRHAVRRLRAPQSTTFLAIVMLGLGIGLTTAMFTIADAMLLRPVPFADPDRLAQVSMMSDRGGRTNVSLPTWKAWRTSAAFVNVESAESSTVLLDVAGTPTMRGGAFVSPGVFPMLGARALRGRLFDETDSAPGAGERIVISEDVWRTSFGRDADIVGRRVSVDGRPAVIIGVVPAEFRFPSWDTVIWRPANFDTAPVGRPRRLPRAYVRFAPGVPPADALRIATDAAHAVDSNTEKLFAQAMPLVGGYFDANAAYGARAVPVLIGSVVLVFLVLCANVGSLLLGRLTARRREFGLCAALGASRFQLLSEAVIESAILASVGGLVGVAFAWGLVSAARTYLPDAFLLRTLNPLNLDVRALGVAFGAGIVATVAAGVLPAWIGTNVSAGQSLRAVERGGTEARGARSVARALLVVEIALAGLLLVGATMLGRSFVNLVSADRGLDTRGVTTATVSLPASAFGDAPARIAATAAIEREIRALPGVTQVAWSFGLPPAGGGLSFGEWKSDAGVVTPKTQIVESYQVGADFFALYGVPVIRGRVFAPGDGADSMIVGERLARVLWPDADPIGRSVSFGKATWQVLGVAREINHPSLNPEVDRPEVYMPFSPGGGYVMLNVRCQGVCPDAAIIRKRLLDSQPAAQIVSAGPLEAAYLEDLARPRTAAALGAAFAVIALLASAGGLFSVLSHAVGRRGREFGIRVALGASPRQIRTLVIREGALVATLGIAIGSSAAWALSRTLASLSYGVTPSDPISWAVVFGILGLTTIAASWQPARQAMRTDPAGLLRQE